MQRLHQLFKVVACLSICLFASRAAFAKSETETKLESRTTSAMDIIKNCNDFTAKAKQLTAQTNAATEKMHRLNGEAKRFNTPVTPKMKPLKGAQLAQAKQMYQTDLNQFSNHVAAYREHNTNVRQQYGECAASRAAYEKNKNSYLIHCKEFHMEDLPPPHVCVTMEQAMSNSTAAAGQLKSSVKRLVDSQIELMKTEARLNAAVANSANVDKDVHKQHELNLKEQDLAVEFAQLQEEHKQLEIEKRTLTASGVRTAVPTVKARIRKN